MGPQLAQLHLPLRQEQLSPQEPRASRSALEASGLASAAGAASATVAKRRVRAVVNFILVGFDGFVEVVGVGSLARYLRLVWLAVMK